MFVDSHIHLTSYPPDQRSAILQRACTAGVTQVLSMAGHEAGADEAIELAHRQDCLLLAVGVHPRRVAGLDLAETIDRLQRLTQDDSVVAIGEVGLDDGDGAPPLELQETFWRAQLELAQRARLPVVLHIVGYHRRAAEVLADMGSQRGVVHYFQGDRTLAQTYLDLGLYISVGKPAARPENAALRDAVTRLPLDRLLIETDSYPAPGRSTEPRDVVLVAEAVAALKGIDVAQIAEATTLNFDRLLGRP